VVAPTRRQTGSRNRNHSSPNYSVVILSEAKDLGPSLENAHPSSLRSRRRHRGERDRTRNVPGTDLSKDKHIYWLLEIRAPLTGPDFSVQFLIPIYDSPSSPPRAPST
jgi:hypothetical protein